MIRRPPRSTQSRSSAASDVYKRQLKDIDEVVLGRNDDEKFVEVNEPDDQIMINSDKNLKSKFKLEYRDKYGRRLSQKEAFRPVSYTHLRAHETVLDLVCRLLLEKKKT
eukprot:TRINITY_DN28944_c0_g2_i1.p1 TRINITY_DN28944_c0_g2~~TRINITY_DN28944_c0_g2_i1.p1  ORF type:complete len:109 (+),score=68.24 TRINITY_DN28944_c0_g2_i1:39-365(+)